MVKYLQRRFALSHKGAVDVIKGGLFCALQNVSFMLPVGLLYMLVRELLSGDLSVSKLPFFILSAMYSSIYSYLIIIHFTFSEKLQKSNIYNYVKIFKTILFKIFFYLSNKL